MSDNRGIILSEALLLLMILSLLGVLCFQTSVSLRKMEQLEDYHNERIKESYEC
ncbi:hypothetical protein WKT02_01365 [Erysipelotrichaceae bacterium HCN-30851]